MILRFAARFEIASVGFLLGRRVVVAPGQAFDRYNAEYVTDELYSQIAVPRWQGNVHREGRTSKKLVYGWSDLQMRDSASTDNLSNRKELNGRFLFELAQGASMTNN